MRIFSFFATPFVLPVLTGNVTVAAQQTVSALNPDIYRYEIYESCNSDKLVQNNQVESGSGAAELNPERISILNWNIYKGQRESWATDFKRYAYKHDVVLMQEAHLGDDLKSILDTGHQYWTLNAAFHYKDKPTGVMTASRVKPVHNCGQHTVEPIIRFPKTSLISYYPVEGMDENLLVANIHGINFTFGIAVYKEQLEMLYEEMQQHNGPIILAGDFNTWSEKRMQLVDDLAQSLALKSLDYTSHNRTIVFGNALDHVFYRGLEPVEHDTWHVTSSDHNPTRVSFRVTNNAAGDTGLAAVELDEDSC